MPVSTLDLNGLDVQCLHEALGFGIMVGITTASHRTDQAVASRDLPHTIEIVASGGSTVIYANASTAPENTRAADMEVHLTGVSNATSSDILHA